MRGASASLPRRILAAFSTILAVGGLLAGTARRGFAAEPAADADAAGHSGAAASSPAVSPSAAATEPPGGAVEFLQRRSVAPEELARRRARGDSLLLQSGVFDPITERAPDFAAGRPVTGEEKSFLVQFQKDLSPSERRKLEAAGLRFVDSVPSHAYLVQTSPAGFAVLSSHPLLRWLDAFRGGYKLAAILRSEAWTEALHLDIRLFPGENPLQLLDRLRAIDGSVRLAAVHGEPATGAKLRVLVPAGRLHPFVEQAAEDRAIRAVEPWFLPRIENNNSIWVIQSYDTTNKLNYALSATLWNHGITGTGQTPAISDTGLDDDMCFFRNSAAASDVVASQSPPLPGTGTIDLSKKVAAYYVLPNATAYDGNTPCNGVAESFHGTHTTGSILGDNYATLSTPSSGGHDSGDGMAPNAKVIFQDVGSELTGCLDGLANDFALIWKQAYDAGARVHSNSWSAPVSGAYNEDSRAIDRIIYTYEDLLILLAAGNSGPSAGTVGAPATAKNCLAVGSTSNGSAGSNSISSFSSRGPTADGRIKPDIVAPGSTVVSASGDADHASNTCGTKTLSGTSMATPTVAGGATLLRQYFTDGFYPSGVKISADALGPSAALLKAALLNGAVDVANTSQATILNSLTPNNNQGFGRIHLDNVAFFSTPTRDPRRTRVWDKWNATGLTTGQNDEYPLQVAAGQPLKVTLAWTDPEASALAAATLINDLDLEVLDPVGTVYRGNVFSGGQSSTGGVVDHVNTVEEVFLKTPVAGSWTLRVKAGNVPGAPSEPVSVRQGYGLVATYADCTASLAAPTGLTATDTGTFGITLSWGAVGGATGYQVYRTVGSCGAPPEAFHLLGQSASTSFTDGLAQGGYTYAYLVRAVTPCTEGPPTTCAGATYTGNCTLTPAFTGASSAINDTTTSACDSLIGWSAGSSSCPLTPDVSYDIYRSTDPYFAPGPGTILAAGAEGTNYRDLAVTPNTTYYYSVRAEDSSTANGGPANGGNLDLNRIVRSATPTSSASYPGTWTDDGGDRTARLLLEAPWNVSHQQNHSAAGTLAYHSGVDGVLYPADTCAAATTPPITLQAGETPILTYWARYDLEYQWDGVVVEISNDGGESWTILNPSPPYPSTLALTGNPPVNACGFTAAQAAFTGPVPNGSLSPWTQYTHDLSGYAGGEVMLRWRFSTDPGLEFEGFYLDDIAITKAMAPASCGADLRLASNVVQTDTCAGGGAGSGNGILEAGEDAEVAASVQNIGDTTATAVMATLSTSQPNVVVTRPTIGFADIPSGMTVGSTSPHFGVWVSPAIACGTVIPFTMQVGAGQGHWTRNFSLTVGSGSPSCTQAVCGSALPAEDGTAPELLRVTRGAGSALDLSFGLSCHAVDSTVYWGQASGHMTSASWSGAACGFGAQEAASFDAGPIPAGGLLYFVVVPRNGVNEGSYGRSSAGVERPAATGLGACNSPQQLGGTCP